MTATSHTNGDDVRDTQLAAKLEVLIGAENVHRDDDLRRLYSQDIWTTGAAVTAMVVSPATTNQMSAIAKVATDCGYALLPRGGGMSYTQGYLAATPNTVLVDTSRMNTILAIDADAMTVHVQSGCSWSALFERLRPYGLRTPFWGPLSGLSSTVGGGLSQLNAFFGSGHYGTSSESVIGITGVLADGRIIRTGAGKPTFYRHFGPDLTGLFCGDAGAFAIKTELVLRLIRTPQHEAYASFAFSDRKKCLLAMADLARSGVACELFGFDPHLAQMRLKRASLTRSVRTLERVMAKEKTAVGAVKSAVRLAVAGRHFIGEADYSVHMVAEGRSQAAVTADLRAARDIARAYDGTEIENSIPKVIRAQPFAPLNTILGPGGERWVPVHGIVSMANANAVYEAVESEFAKRSATFQQQGIETGFMFTTLSTNGFLIEPVFFWPDARQAIHEVTVEPNFLAKLPKLTQRPSATAAVAEARRGIISVFESFHAAHFQIGRTYPYLNSLDSASKELLETIKHFLDPFNRLNPGALGLPQ